MPDLHPRQQLRHAAVAALLDKTAAGARVYRMRVAPNKTGKLPSLSVYTPGEDVDTEASMESAPRELERVIELVVDAIVEAGPEDVDDAIDALCLEVENALHADPTLGGVVADLILSRTDSDAFGEGGKTIGLAKLTFRVEHNGPAAPSPDLSGFTHADVRYNPRGTVHPDDQAHDVVPLPQED
jgi:hypothetical protein